jgi:hypothetical protein
MKAPSVREGSKENGTQVTGNRIYKGCLVRQGTLAGQAFIQRTIANSPGSASRDGRKLVDRFMAGKPKIAPRSRSAKMPPVSITFRRRGQTFYYHSPKVDTVNLQSVTSDHIWRLFLLGCHKRDYHRHL